MQKPFHLVRLNCTRRDLLRQKLKALALGQSDTRLIVQEMAMTGAKLREAMDLLRNLKQQYPAESDELLQQRLREKLGCDPAMRRAIIEDI